MAFDVERVPLDEVFQTICVEFLCHQCFLEHFNVADNSGWIHFGMPKGERDQQIMVASRGADAGFVTQPLGDWWKVLPSFKSP